MSGLRHERTFLVRQRALRVVERDRCATGSERVVDIDLVQPGWAREWGTAHVWCDGKSRSSGIGSWAGFDPGRALEAVQEQVMEFTWTVWPLCRSIAAA